MSLDRLENHDAARKRAGKNQRSAQGAVLTLQVEVVFRSIRILQIMTWPAGAIVSMSLVSGIP
jgi:hypothetical protein